MMPEAKQEGDNNNDPMLPTSYRSSSRQWAGFKNPRIVRVSKAFGGKDRHSKVCTVKGLRDRRIRLSVPTAIQLYDLQDRLGVNQPSKVIDWLLDSTKNDIDQLPPLQMLPQDYTQFHPLPPSLNIQQDLNSPQVSFTQFLNTPNATFVKDVGNRTLLYTKQDINGDHQRKKGKETVKENEGLNFFPYNPNYYNWEPSSNLSLSQFGNQTLVSSQTDNSSMTSSSASQFSFTPYHMPNLGENHDVFRQNNHFHMLSSSTSQNVPSNAPRPILFNQLISDSQEKVPFGLDQSPKTDNR